MSRIGVYVCALSSFVGEQGRGGGDRGQKGYGRGDDRVAVGLNV